MSKPRLLFISDHLGHADGRIHGATRYFLTVLPRLQAAGFAVEAVFLRDEHPQAHTLREAGINPVFLNCSKTNFLAYRPLRKLIRERKVDLVHASGLKGMLMARLAVGATPLFLHLHDMLPVRPAIAGRLLGSLFSRADRVLCISDAVRAFALDHFHLPEAKCLTLRNGIPLTPSPKLSPGEVHTEVGLNPDRPLFIWVGRLDDTKNPFDAVETFSLIASHPTQPSLLIVGEGDGKDRLQQQVDHLNLKDRVILAGQRDDLPRLLAAADLMLCTPKSEGLGLAAMEALAEGCPVLAYRVGGLTEVVHDGTNGRLLPSNQPKALADAAAALLESPDDLKAMSASAKSSADAFDLQRHIDTLTSLYSEMLS